MQSNVKQAAIEEFLPAEFRVEAQSQWNDFCRESGEGETLLSLGIDFCKTLLKVWISSPFVFRQCKEHPELLMDLIRSGDLMRDRTDAEYSGWFADKLADIRNEKSLQSTLRQMRNQEMVRIAWRDIACWTGLDQTLLELSWLADICVETVLQFYFRELVLQYGMPRSLDHQPQSLVVLGMGKLGAFELNFSSDIDLIFAFPEDGETDSGLPISNEEFFNRLGQKIVNSLSINTHEGFVFRVDMRLRPYGSDGPLALSFDAIEDYYQSQGREWERYAMIKARPIAGDLAAGEALLKILRPFVYRRYLDYGVMAGLREMKDMIEQQLKRKGFTGNIKLGKGGIREIEFIGQTFQLVRGGRDPELQMRALQPLLRRLELKGHLREAVAEKLLHAYRLLRYVENRLQQEEDQQTHLLPREKISKARIAFSLQEKNWKSLEAKLMKIMSWVQVQFEQVFFAQQGTATIGTSVVHPAHGVLKGEVEYWDGDRVLAWLRQLGFDHPGEVLGLVAAVKATVMYKMLSLEGKTRLDHLLPLLMERIAHYSHESKAVEQLLQTLESMLGRTVYLALLYENVSALDQFVKLCTASAWIARQVARQPILLDEMIDPRRLTEPLDKQRLHEELLTRQRSISQDDYEQLLEMLRQFKQANLLKVATVDLLNLRPLMVVSDYLTMIAEKLIEQCLQYSWDHLAKRFGTPSFVTDRPDQPQGFLVVGYGKLGGIELGYASDLDLVFLHRDLADKGRTSGPQKISDYEFFIRLAQRFINLMTTNMPSGILYDVDVRLRPNGDSGFLATSMQSFREYQERDAWVWEHQALVRARPICGTADLVAQFQKIRADILSRQRDANELGRAVTGMREKMRRELLGTQVDYFDLKQSHGGMVDIEFMMQYAVLRWSHQFPELVQYSDNVRISEQLGKAGCIHQADAKLLKAAYLAYRGAAHKLALQDASPRVAIGEYLAFRDAVTGIWNKFFI